MANAKKTDTVSAIPASEIAALKEAPAFKVEESTGLDVEVVEYEETIIDLGNGAFATNYGPRKN